MKRFYLLFLVILLLIFPLLAFAQNGAPANDFDWTQLGVNVTIVVVILSFVQTIKKLLPPKMVVWAPFVLSILISAAYGAVTHNSNFIEIIKYAFLYATAAAYMYDMGNKFGLLRGRKQFTNY